jgi:hypothetical protein
VPWRPSLACRPSSSASPPILRRQRETAESQLAIGRTKQGVEIELDPKPGVSGSRIRPVHRYRLAAQQRLRRPAADSARCATAATRSATRPRWQQQLPTASTSRPSLPATAELLSSPQLVRQRQSEVAVEVQQMPRLIPQPPPCRSEASDDDHDQADLIRPSEVSPLSQRARSVTPPFATHATGWVAWSVATHAPKLSQIPELKRLIRRGQRPRCS